VADFRKLAGILVETSGEMQGPSVAVIGVGVNYRLGERVIDLIDQPVTDVAQCSASLPSRSELLARLLASLGAALEDFETAGFAASRDAWRSLHAYQGRRVRVVPPREAPFEADVVDVAPDGALVVATLDGRTVPLASAEISLRPK
jgi:BirA family biotin operon repressor/biotin-[acetyl-CoA-carboxylase] ligase